MRKLILLQISLFFLQINTAISQDVSIPEGPFKTYLMNRYPGCFVNLDIDGFLMMNTACSAITTEDSLEFHNLGLAGDPLDLTGLQYFTSVLYLNCSNNQIQTYVYPPILKFLDCSNSMADQPFGTFPAFPSSLETLICKDNVALGIPFSPGLKYIDISGNYCYSMAALPNGLEKLICKDQCSASGIPRLTSLPALPSSLKYLDCSSNQLTSIPALPASMDTLICAFQFGYLNPQDYFKTLVSLPVLPAALKYLDCSSNKLTDLPSLPATLKYLRCSGQRTFKGDLEVSPSNPEEVVSEGISSLPVLPNGLLYLDCKANKLTSLPAILPATLTFLDVSFNVYTFYTLTQTEGIQCLPRLPATLTNLNTSQTLINCHPNSGTYTATPTRPLCSPVNNIYQCVTAPIVSGDVFYDNNSNGIREGVENPRAFVEVNLSNGQTGFTDLNGHFELSADIGSNTLTVENPVYYSSVPASRIYAITSFTDVVNDAYALQPTVMIDSLRFILATTSTARPGFTVSYIGEYENIGTTVVTPQLSFVFDNSRMLFEPLLSSAGATVSGNTITIPGSLVGPGDIRTFAVFFNINVSVALGDTIHVSATATANTHISSDSLFSVVRGAFDPNDKRATPTLSLNQVAQGAYVNYLVRFQNTGTDTAFNVVVSDLLNNLLDPASFQILGTSHNSKVTRNGSTIYFEFLNILLPDSNVNEPTSHGWIRFRVKPVSTIPLNSVIPNNVAIYFDYNNPVITNTANTNIQLAPVPLTLLSFRGMADPAGKNALLTWETAEERNSSYFEVQYSKDGTQFEQCGIVQAAGSGSVRYQFIKPMLQEVEYFRLRMVDADAAYTYSPVVKVKLAGKANLFTILNNPVIDMLQIKLVEGSLKGSTAFLIDSKGAIVKQFILQNGIQQIPVSHLSKGIYYFKTSFGTSSFMIGK